MKNTRYVCKPHLKLSQNPKLALFSHSSCKYFAVFKIRYEREQRLVVADRVVGKTRELYITVQKQNALTAADGGDGNRKIRLGRARWLLLLLVSSSRRPLVTGPFWFANLKTPTDRGGCHGLAAMIS